MLKVSAALLVACLLVWQVVNTTNVEGTIDNDQHELVPNKMERPQSPSLTAVIQMLEDTSISQNQPLSVQNVPSAELQLPPTHQTKNPKHLSAIQPLSVAKSHFIERFKLTPTQQQERTGKILLSLQTAIRRAKRDPTGEKKVAALEKAFSKAILRVQNIRRSRRRRHRSRSSSRSANSTSVRHRTRTRRSRSKSRSSSTNSSSSSSSSSNSNSFNLSWSSSTTDSTTSSTSSSSSSSTSSSFFRRRRHHKKRSSRNSSIGDMFKKHHHTRKRNRRHLSTTDPSHSKKHHKRHEKKRGSRR